MAGSFIVNGSNVTIRFEYTADLTKAQETVEAAAHWLWEHGASIDSVEFDNLNNNQKLALVDAQLRRHVIDMAKAYDANKAAEDARLAALGLDKYISEE